MLPRLRMLICTTIAFSLLSGFVMTQNSLRDTAKFYNQPHLVYFSVRRLTKESVMNYEEKIIQAISISLVVAYFLLNTGRTLKAIELCKESLLLLSDKPLSIEKQLGQSIHKAIYNIMFKVYRRVSDHRNAIACGRKLLAIYRERVDTVEEGKLSIALAQIYLSQSMFAEAKEFYERAITIMEKTGNKRGEGIAYEGLGPVFLSLGEYVKAKEYCEKALAISMEIGHRPGEATCYGNLGNVFCSLGEYVKAKEYYEKALAISMEIGDRAEEATWYGNLGNVFCSLGEYVKAKEYYEKALAISMEIGHRAKEATWYGNLGNVFRSLGDYVKAKEYYEKALAISMEIGHRSGEATCYGNLGTVFRSLGDYVKAKEYYEKALAISMEIGHRATEATWYGNLGTVFQSLGEYVKAKEYYEKALAISMEIGHRPGEATCYGNLGTVFRSLGDYVKAKEYYEKALAISMEIGHRPTEGTCYVNLGNLFFSLDEHVKAKEYYEKALALSMEIGHRPTEGTCYGNLGSLFFSLDEYVKAKEYYEKALAISMEIGQRATEATWYGNLGTVFCSLGEYVKAKEYYEKALAISMEIGERATEATWYGNLGNVFLALGKYGKVKEYHEKAIAISMEIGDKKAEADCYLMEGHFHKGLGDNDKAKACLQKALAIAVEIGDRKGEASSYLSLGQVFQSRGDHDVAEAYLEKALSISEDIGNAEIEFRCYCVLTLTKLSQTLTKLSQKSFQEAFSLLFRSIEKSEKMRGFLQDSDQMKISFADMRAFPYQQLSELFCYSGNPQDALYVTELGRARALADLMGTQYCTENRISADPQSWTVVETVMKKESNCTCLYISYFYDTVFLWILKTNGVIQFRKLIVDKKTLHTRLAEVARNLDEFFAIMAQSFRTFGILPEEVCEDRSLNDSSIESHPESCQEENLATLRQGKPWNTDDPERSLTLFYELLVNPVSDLLDEPEVIIVPDRNLYRVPFPALLDESGKFLSERFRSRVVPSLSTLKLIQDSPADYHSQTGALVVGDPDVGVVIYRGSVNRKFVPLPGARKEAEMIARRLGVDPLLGQDATKKVVLEKLNSVSLIHIAAHGNAERGEIALSPPRSNTGIPREDDYLLKMSDISKVKVRAKLVVLSCCHSGRGQIRAEGVIGIARSFLGSGARSVLVALWALDDTATKKLMSRFYEHLVRGESASVSLHAAMKWMRDHGFIKASRWAPFMLIGDDVTFAFEKY